MSSTTIAAEAVLDVSTQLDASASVKLLGTGDQGSCGFAPRWWCLDLSVSGDVVASSGGERPGTPAFDGFPGRAPFILQVEHGVLGPRARQPGLGAPHIRLIDATSGLTYVLASSVTVNLLGPKSLRTYSPDQPGRFDNRGTVAVGRFNVSLSPCECAGPSDNRATLTWRAHILAGDGGAAQRFPIPPGAIELQIFDASGSGLSWGWYRPDGGPIPVPAPGLSAIVRVPNATHVGPVSAHGAARDVTLVWRIAL